MNRKIWLAAAVFCALLGGRAYVADMGKPAAEESLLQAELKEETKETGKAPAPKKAERASSEETAKALSLSTLETPNAVSGEKEVSATPKGDNAEPGASIKAAPDVSKETISVGPEAEETPTTEKVDEETTADTVSVSDTESKKKKGEGRTISPEHPLVILADSLQYQTKSGDVAAEGDVDMTHMGERYRTERIYGNNKTQHYVIPETVYWTAPGNTAEAQSAEYDGLSGISTFSEFSGWHQGLYYYRGTDGVYNRKTNVATVQNAYFTTKHAVARVPDYRIEAESIDIYPGDRYVAHHPSLFFKNTRIITLGSYTGSLRHDGISAWSLIPMPMYDSRNGFGLRNAFEMPIGGVQSDLFFYSRLAWYTKRGLTPDIGFRYETPQGTFRFQYAKVESTYNNDHIWLEKRPSLTFQSRSYPIKNTRLYAGFGGEIGYWKQKNGPAGSYKMWDVWLRHAPITLGKHLALNLGVGYTYDYYGYQNRFRKNAYYTVGINGNYGIFSAWASFRNNNQVGRTPYAFDTYDMTKPVSTGFRVQLTSRDSFSVNYSIDTVNGILKHRDYTYYRDMHSFIGWVQYRSIDDEWNFMIQPKDFTF